jgi:hypothetical protein
MDVEQYHLMQKGVVSSLHEKLTKGEKIVRHSLHINFRIGGMTALGKRCRSVRRGCQGKERRVQDQDESTEVPQE